MDYAITVKRKLASNLAKISKDETMLLKRQALLDRCNQLITFHNKRISEAKSPSYVTLSTEELRYNKARIELQKRQMFKITQRIAKRREFIEYLQLYLSGKRMCGKCEVVKDHSEFYNKKSGSGPNYSCKKCHKQYVTDYVRRNWDKHLIWIAKSRKKKSQQPKLPTFNQSLMGMGQTKKKK